jgi:hypothetical protein
MNKVRIGLCGIVRNEIRSILEWLAHYKALGFTDFLIYDNESTDGTERVLLALEEAGELVHLDWPHAVGARPQRLAYEHARKNAAVDWLAFFDADEFLLLREDASIGAFLGRFGPDVSAIAVNWVVFGSGGAARYRALPVTERFTDALPALAPPNHQVKAIGRRERLVGTGIHRVAPGEGRYVTPSGAEAEFVGLTSVRWPDVAVACLHHYAVKSAEEFAEKRMRGHANSQDPDKKLRKLEAALAGLDAGGVRNADMLAWSAPMRAQAMRLRGILLAAGVHYPVWPFVEDGEG